jgi:signal transduction histidine kinase
MITATDLRSRLDRTVGGLSVLDVAAAVILSAYAVSLTSGALRTGHPHGGAAASIGVLAMTLPVAWRRPLPLAAAGLLAAGAAGNGLVFGPMVRCGATLPAVFLVAFAVGAHCDRTRSAAGLLLCAGSVSAQTVYDPRLGARVLVLMLAVLAGFFAAGRLARARTEAARALRLRSADLRRQREQTARLAVLADRARIAEGLEGVLDAQIGGIASTAEAGRRALNADAAAVRQALISIEHRGRDVLRQMRAVLGALQEDSPGQPQPTLAQLPDLLATATAAGTRLTVEGSPRALPAGLELSGYRIVEHLLLAMDDAPNAVIDVRLRFCPDALELHVCGPPAPSADLRPMLAAARERVSLHGGTVNGRSANGLCHAMARLPLISGHA